MAVSLPNGAIIEMASGYGPSKVMSAISNADPAVATLEASHGIVADDIIEVISGWSKITERIFKAGTPATNDVPIVGLDATSVARFPAGGGAGSVREISGWTQLLQVLTSQSNGGEQGFTEYQFMESDSKRRIPNSKAAAGLVLSIADDTSLAGYQLAETANDDKQPRAVRVTLPSGAVLLYNCYVSMNKTPTLTIDEVMAIEVTLSLLSEVVRY